ncbi:MAG: hypothetical protein OXO52_01490 [Rhodospirillales bacterium]|nr:hypothetical protein [Rhodospirillales bacterium]
MSRKARGAQRRLRTGELPGARIMAGASALAIGVATHGIAIQAAGTAALTTMLVAPAAAQDGEEVYRQEALAHARAISEAWRRLEDHILRRSGAAVSWPGSIPPAATGWLDAWTERGVRARYCENTLLVYMEPEALKGVGRDQRSVQVAPHLYAGDDGGPQLAALHWLTGGAASGAAEGTAGRPDVALPACLSDSSFGGPLPSRRAALAGTVRDPHLDLSERVSHERTVEDCPAGSHGGGRTMTREVRQTHDGRGDPVGNPVRGTWQVSIDDCRADYSEWEHYTLECSWLAGPPHNREMTGQEIWRREKTVTAVGVSWGTPEFVSTSCWEGQAPALPQAQVTETLRTETTSGACPAGYSGTAVLSRTVTERATLWPWDAQPTLQDIPGNWIADETGCLPVVSPPIHTDKFTPPGGPTGTGTGGPGDGTCGPSGEGGGSDGPGDGTCSGPGVGPGAGNGSGGGCFLTEAVVGARGIEADDGPTLTALRTFRDGYMQRTPERRALVTRYYEIAPRIAQAIPSGHAEWSWIGGRIGAAVAAIAAGDDDRAFAIYVAMVRRLETRWLEPAREASCQGVPLYQGVPLR